jgi:hypothetical protein
MTFLDTHLIIKIRDKVKSINHIGFIWLDKPIYDKNFVIDRIKMDPYQSEEVLPLSWYAISRNARLEIYKALDKNEVSIKKTLGDGYYLTIKPEKKLKIPNWKKNWDCT